jgi:hypothetical protein
LNRLGHVATFREGDPMRGLVAVAALCGATLFTAGCGNTGGTARHSAPPAAKPVNSAHSPKPTVAADVSPDPKSQVICDDLHNNVLDDDAKAFGTELGRMIAARAQKDKAGEGLAQQAATAKLGEIAGKLRTHAGEATDSRLRSALNASAANLDKLGADTGTFAGLDSLDAVSQTTAKFAAALGDAADYCA